MHASPDESRAGPEVPLRISVVSHTHWDREWYHTAARFRQRLVALLDAVLARNHSGESFLLDGQAITLLDYLAVRPEREAALGAGLRSGALEAGPWFVLADNLIPSGEAILRNLEAGHRVLHRFGAATPPVAYCPDTFGHPAALPAIAAGYGFPVAVVWRGAGGATHPAADAFRWHAPDESTVVVHHLPPDGYEYGSALPTDVHAADARWHRMQPVLSGRNRTGIVLLLNGADHHALQPDIHDAVAALRVAAAPAAIVERASLTTFAKQFDAAGRTAALPNVRGELRDSYGYTWTLGGTLGTRAHQKRRNARLERALLRDVEPWLALSWLQHARARSRATSDNGTLNLAQLPALLNTAWQELLETHPHDTLCGCSTDEVARAMEVRQESVHAQVQGLRDAALQLALQHDVVAARSRAVQPASNHAIVVRNRAATARGGVVELRLIETLGDVAVGPGGADVPPVTAPSEGNPPRLAGALLQPLDARVVHSRRESPQHYPDNDLVRVHHAIAWIPEVPAFGLRVFGDTTSGEIGAPRPVRVMETGSGIVLDNGPLRVTFHQGQVGIEQHGRQIANALRLESTADLGDSYTPSLRGAAERLVCVDTRVRQRGPLRGAVRLRWESTTRDIRVETTLVLDAEADVLRCDVRGVNRRRNHRLQLVWHTGLEHAVTTADAAFGPVTRHLPTMPVNTHGAPREAVVPTMPMHRWAMQSDDGHCVTVFADGLAEAESTPGALAVTLVRAIGQLSCADLPERPGHAGWPSPIPAAQCLGPFAARVGIMLHPDGPDVMPRNGRAADALLLPLTGETWRDLEVAPTASSLSGPRLVGSGLEASAVTLAQRSDGVILRAVNLTDDTVSGRWILPHEGPWSITRCRLDETPCEAARSSGAQVDFVAGPREIVTVHIAAAP
ncbi:glycoside hydrolase family 38 C-terminal domain-containing protein [Gemmatimonas sp.]|uniref:glycoside hydrolase family 38 N-terminal domain-containing protein n=1 Tax=Gemmatimonas sp. TaxID=1962908 RepID=UPI0037BF7792